MPRQQVKPPFPPFEADEQLYRHLYEKWIDAGGRVRDAAIDLQATSVDRSLIAGEPSDSLARADADYVAAATIAFADIPSRFEAPPENPKAKPPTPYDSVVVHKPENGNDAHSEIQFWRVGDSEASKPQSKPIKAQIREQLAARLRVVCRR